MPFHLLAALAGGYLGLSLGLAYVVHRFPRKPVEDRPDWGRVMDTRIRAIDGGYLEVWKVEPGYPDRGTVVFTHGWSRNRDRMVSRARVFGALGFTTVLFSARDHGGSSPYRFMNALRFCEDLETVMGWVGRPVILYGHSIGAAASVLAASRNLKAVELLFLEGCYPRTKRALRQLYGGYGGFLGRLLAPAVVEWMDLFYGFRMDGISPARIAGALDLPVLLIHGELDQHFPLEDARALRDSFPAGRAEFFVATGADHSGASLTPGYEPAVISFLKRHGRLDQT
jgi:pimeloyl-ACP methyl ester carboxylesterase